MAGGLLAWNNRIDTAELSVSGMGSDLTSPENLKDRHLSRVWRRDCGGGVSYLEATLADPSSIRLVAMLGVSPMVESINEATVTLADSKGDLVELSITPLPVQGAGTTFPACLFFDFGERLMSVTKVKVFIPSAWADSTGGILEIGRLWASDGLPLPEGFDEGWAQSVTAPGARYKSGRRNQAYTRPAGACRTTTFSSSAIDEADVLVDDNPVWRPTVQQLAFETASYEECIALIRTDSQVYLQSLGVYGSLAKSVSWDHAGANYYNVAFEHREGR